MDSRTWSTPIDEAISSSRVGKSMPKKHGHATGGLEMRTWTSAAPASRSIATSARCVLPRTMESSMTTRRLPSMTSRRGLSLRRMPSWRRDWVGSMKVLPT